MDEPKRGGIVCAHYQRVKDHCSAHREGGCSGAMIVRVMIIDESDGSTETICSQLCEAHARWETEQFDHEGSIYERRDHGDEGWSVVPIKIDAAATTVH